MLVGICHTKIKADATALTNAFKRGIESQGDKVIEIPHVKDLWKLENCDVSFQVCDQHFSDREAGGLQKFDGNNFRAGTKLFKKNRIILDAGFIKHGKQFHFNEAYYSININSIKRFGTSHTKNSPPDRWKKLGIKKPTWRKDGDHVLVIGQNEQGVGTSSIRKKGLSFLEWSNNILKKIRNHTNRKIIYKPHPHQAFLPDAVENCIVLPVSTEDKISNYFLDCWCAVSLASNGAIDCVMNGIPVVTSDKMSMVYDISSHSLKEIENPKMQNITQWLYDISYTQWNMKEIELGESWLYIKTHLSHQLP